MIQTSRAFGLAVRQARTAKDLSQVDLAELAGVSRSWLSELETGKRSVELGRALLVLSALDLAVSIVPAPTTGVDLARLLDGEVS